MRALRAQPRGCGERGACQQGPCLFRGLLSPTSREHAVGLSRVRRRVACSRGLIPAHPVSEWATRGPPGLEAVTAAGNGCARAGARGPGSRHCSAPGPAAVGAARAGPVHGPPLLLQLAIQAAVLLSGSCVPAWLPFKAICVPAWCGDVQRGSYTNKAYPCTGRQDVTWNSSLRL